MDRLADVDPMLLYLHAATEIDARLPVAVVLPFLFFSGAIDRAAVKIAVPVRYGNCIRRGFD
jgi:hypothetical protein